MFGFSYNGGLHETDLCGSRNKRRPSRRGNKMRRRTWMTHRKKELWRSVRKVITYVRTVPHDLLEKHADIESTVDNASNFSTGQAAASLTSTALAPTTKNDKALFDEVREYRMFSALRKCEN